MSTPTSIFSENGLSWSKHIVQLDNDQPLDDSLEDSTIIRLSNAIEDQNDYQQKVYLLLSCIILILVLAIAIFFILYYKKHFSNSGIKNIFSNQNKLFKNNKKQHRENKELFTTLETVIIEGKTFMDFNLTIGFLAKKLNVSRNQLSYTINQYTGKNFNQYINEFRIKEIIRIISDPEKKNINIETVAENAGFNSRSAFYKAFKNFTGVTPSQFKRKNLS